MTEVTHYGPTRADHTLTIGTFPGRFDRVYRYEFDGHVIEVGRQYDRTAYARNGNVGNPTKYYRYLAFADGEYVGKRPLRRDAYEIARQSIAPTPEFVTRYRHEVSGRWITGVVRPFRTIDDEMKNAFVSTRAS